MAEVISFPKTNPRVTEKDIITTEEILEKKKTLRMNFFKDAADDIVENTVRDIASLELSTLTGRDLSQLQAKDIIMLREALVSIMCRLTDIDHPLHKITENLIISEETVDEYGDAMYGYSFKESDE